MDAKPTGKLIGYARVSTDDQELRSQIDALERAGCLNIWKEHASASRGRKRPELEKALLDLRPGDTLVVYKLDRLSRRLRELFLILDRLHEAGAGFKSLTEQIDWSTPTGRLLLGVFGSVAQFVAEQTAERTRDGIASLRERGWSPGAPPKLSKKRGERLVAEYKAGATKVSLAKKYGLSPAGVTLYLKRARRKGRKAQ